VKREKSISVSKEEWRTLSDKLENLLEEERNHGDN
jgi:hypothetical protein